MITAKLEYFEIHPPPLTHYFIALFIIYHLTFVIPLSSVFLFFLIADHDHSD